MLYMSTRRDNFTSKTKEILAKRVGYLCSNPNCRKLTVGAHELEDKSTSIGIAAHITAASEGGPRYDATITKEQRIHIDNGIWLCSNCATLIDKDPENYSIDLLKEWKSLAERESLERLKGNYDQEQSIQMVLPNGEEVVEKLSVLIERLVSDEKREIQNLKELIRGKEESLRDKRKLVEFQDSQIIQLKSELAEKQKQLENSENRFSEIFMKNDGNDFSNSGQLYGNAMDALVKGDKKRALAILERQRLLEQKEALEKEREQQAESWLLRAELLKDESIWGAELLECYEIAIEIAPTWYYYFLAANFLQFVNQFDKAESYYQVCLEKSKTENHKALVLNNLGALLNTMNEYEKCERCYNTALEIKRLLVKKNEHLHLKDLGKAANNLGVVLMDRNQYERAEEAYKEALMAYEKLSEKYTDDVVSDIAMTANNMGILYFKQNEIDKSEQRYQQSLALYRKLAIEDSKEYLPYLAFTLNNFADIYIRKNELDKADSFYVEALSIRRELVNDNPQTHLPSLANVLNNLGVLNTKKEEYDQSQRYHEESLSIARELAKDVPRVYLPDISRTLNNLGIVHRYKKELEKSQAYYEEALEIKTALAEEYPDVYLADLADLLSNIGDLYQAQRKFEQAEESYQKSLDTFKRITDDAISSHLPKLAKTLINMSVLYQNYLINKERSLQCVDEALILLIPFSDIPYIQSYMEFGYNVLRGWDIDVDTYWQERFKEE